MIQLYPHQQEQVQQTRQAMRSSRGVLLQSATGSGKSVMAAYMISAALDKGSKSLFVVPRRELLRQMADTFAKFHIPHSFIAAGYPCNPKARVHIASAASLRRKVDIIKPNVVFIDETHYGGAALDHIISYYKAQGAWIVGLSATPVKLSGQGLDCWYDTMVPGKSMEWLIKNGWLSDYKGYAPSTADLAGIKKSRGDYHRGDLADRMEKDIVLMGKAAEHYKTHAMGKLNIAYCTSVRHSELQAQAFRDIGVPAMSIDGKTPDDERKRIIKAFAKREILALCNCDLLTFGFDLSSSAGMDVTVESMSDLRPTMSLALQCQKWGRVLRKKDEPALIFDHGNNFQKHGLPCEDREWSLEGVEKGVGEKERTLAVRECPKCFRCHSPAPVCPQCGHVYVVESKDVREIEVELKEIKKAEMKRKKAARVKRVKDNEKLTGAALDSARDKRRAWLKKSGKPSWLINKIMKDEGL